MPKGHEVEVKFEGSFEVDDQLEIKSTYEKPNTSQNFLEVKVDVKDDEEKYFSS